MKYTTAISVTLATALISGIAIAADITQEEFEERVTGVAVSDVNGKLEFGYTEFDFGPRVGNPTTQNLWDDGSAFTAKGAISVPLSQQFGLQLDAGYLGSEVDFTGGTPAISDRDLTAYGIGGHFFWRDSNKGLLGLYADYVDYELENSPAGFNEFSTSRLAVEGEAYLENVTFKALVGVDNLDVGTLGDEDFFAASGGIDYYLNENFMLSAGVRHSFDQTAGVVGMEALLNEDGVATSAFAEAAFAEDASSVSVGLKFYLAKNPKTLINRHREDDPQIALFANTALAANCIGGIINPNTSDSANTGVSAMSDAPSAGPIISNGSVLPNARLDGCDVDFDQNTNMPYVALP